MRRYKYFDLGWFSLPLTSLPSWMVYLPSCAGIGFSAMYLSNDLHLISLLSPASFQNLTLLYALLSILRVTGAVDSGGQNLLIWWNTVSACIVMCSICSRFPTSTLNTVTESDFNPIPCATATMCTNTIASCGVWMSSGPSWGLLLYLWALPVFRTYHLWSWLTYTDL